MKCCTRVKTFVNWKRLYLCNLNVISPSLKFNMLHFWYLSLTLLEILLAKMTMLHAEISISCGRILFGSSERTTLISGVTHCFKI